MTRQIMRVDLTQGAINNLEKTRERLGKTSLQMNSQLFEWFAEQDREIQQQIMRGEPTVARDIARQMASR